MANEAGCYLHHKNANIFSCLCGFEGVAEFGPYGTGQALETVTKSFRTVPLMQIQPQVLQFANFSLSIVLNAKQSRIQLLNNLLTKKSMLTTHFSKLWRLIFFSQRKLLFQNMFANLLLQHRSIFKKNTKKDRLNPPHQT